MDHVHRSTINVKQVGHAILHIDAFDEDYLITFPSLHIEGLIRGSPYVELNKSSYIVSSSGLTSRVDYAGAGWVSGTKNSFSAVVFPHGKEKSKSDIIYTIEGVWTDSFTVKDAGKHVVDSYNAKSEPKTALQVADVANQDPLESRRAWKKVADAIIKGDMNVVSHEKTLIEEQQRALRKQETASNQPWERTFFTKTNNITIADKLIREVPHGALEQDQTGGVWLFDSAKASKAKPPYNQLSVTLKDGWK
jgi:hypothetical protein